MSEKRSQARARALRAARVVTIAGAILGMGCTDSFEEGDATVTDSMVEDASIPDAQVVDGSVICPQLNMCLSPAEVCGAMSQECCDENGGQYDQASSECCVPGCAVGPLAPPELMG